MQTAPFLGTGEGAVDRSEQAKKSRKGVWCEPHVNDESLSRLQVRQKCLHPQLEGSRRRPPVSAVPLLANSTAGPGPQQTVIFRSLNRFPKQHPSFLVLLRGEFESKDAWKGYPFGKLLPGEVFTLRVVTKNSRDDRRVGFVSKRNLGHVQESITYEETIMCRPQDESPV